MKKFGILALVLSLPLAANAATINRAESANDLQATTTSSYTGLSQRNIFTTYHDPAKLNTDTNNLNNDNAQLQADLKSGNAQNIAADRDQIASDRARQNGDYQTYNSANNTGVYSNINSPITVTHTDTYHENSYRHKHEDVENQ